MLALIDMDLVIFRCAASAENDPLSIAQYRANELLYNILEKVDATAYKAYISSDTNFRKDIYPEYKAQRNPVKPIHLRAMKDYAFEHMDAILSPDGLEADDMLGIEQDKVGWWSPHNGEERQHKTVICTLDKDLLQIPGNHFSWMISGPNWVRPDTHSTQTELEGYRLFYEQALKGDPTDNIKGIPRMGKVKAKRALEGCASELDMFNTVRNLYGNDEEFLLNAGCVWILREHGETFKERFTKLATLQE
jgi:5'-3' exonuclease